MSQQLIQKAAQNIKDILKYSIKFDPITSKALVVFDTQNELTNILTTAYKNALSQAEFVNFDSLSKKNIIAKFNTLNQQDLVVLIQTGSFRLDDFRIRIHLFNKKLKVVEHMHLYRNPPQTWESYINSLAYDAGWYHGIGSCLQKKLSNTDQLVIKSGNDSELTVIGGVEFPKLNTGDYANNSNIGGTFPIGEVFTEAKDFSKMNGSVWVYAFADKNFEIIMPEKFRVDIKNGLIISYSKNTPQEFINVLELVKTLERPIIREIGFGLNRAIDKRNPLGDITAFERIVGVHLSLGEKHSVYKKEGITAHKARFHVDLFVDTNKVLLDGKTVFKNNEYQV